MGVGVPRTGITYIQGVTTHDMRCTKGLDISGRHPVDILDIMAVGFG